MLATLFVLSLSSRSLTVLTLERTTNQVGIEPRSQGPDCKLLTTYHSAWHMEGSQ